MTTYNLNNEVNGVEIKFDEKPSTEILENLHANHWRWHKYKKIWYNKQTEENINFAKSVAENNNVVDVAIDQQKVIKHNTVKNIHNVKVGDIFYTSWGYDMTLVYFYQVIRVTPKMASVKEIRSKIVEGDGFIGKCIPVKDSFVNDEIYNTSTDFAWNNKEEAILKNADGRKNIGYKWQSSPIYFNHMD